MDDFSKPPTLAKALGISRSYAWEILKGVRQPSRALAISIFQKTGLKFAPISHLDDAQIVALDSLLRDAA